MNDFQSNQKKKSTMKPHKSSDELQKHLISQRDTISFLQDELKKISTSLKKIEGELKAH